MGVIRKYTRMYKSRQFPLTAHFWICTNISVCSTYVSTQLCDVAKVEKMLGQCTVQFKAELFYIVLTTTKEGWCDIFIPTLGQCTMHACKCVAYGSSHYMQIYMKANVVKVFLYYLVLFTTKGRLYGITFSLFGTYKVVIFRNKLQVAKFAKLLLLHTSRLAGRGLRLFQPLHAL